MMNCILITGANRGIGLELVKQYYGENWHVIACSRYPKEVEKAISAYPVSQAGQLSSLQVDVTHTDDIRKLNEAVKDLKIDILLNNAGVWGPSQTEFGSVLVEDWLEVFRANTVAPLILAQTLIKQIERSQLRIIANMSSNMGSIGENSTGGYYVYRSSKAALNAITKSMAMDLKDKGITVVSLHPGWVKTDMGGMNAPVTTAESVHGIRKVLSTITLQDTGSFIGYDGKKLLW